MFYWILLALAIATEITGTLSMKWASVGNGNAGFILMLVMITLSYIFLSFAVEAAHEKRESVSNKIRKLKLSRFN